MFRHLVLCLLLCISGLAAFAATTTVVLNGQAVTVPVIESNGKAFVDIAALMKLLGGSATFNADAHKLFINSSGQSTTPARTACLGLRRCTRWPSSRSSPACIRSAP